MMLSLAFYGGVWFLVCLKFWSFGWYFASGYFLIRLVCLLFLVLGLVPLGGGLGMVTLPF